MGIDKADIRNVIRNGVPENVLSWAQELGRAGKMGNKLVQQFCTTGMTFHMQMPAWVLNNLQCKEHCSCIFKGFSKSWRYVQAHLVGICRRRMLLDLFLEKQTLKPYQLGLVVMYASLRQAVTLQLKTCAKNLQC